MKVTREKPSFSFVNSIRSYSKIQGFHNDLNRKMHLLILNNTRVYLYYKSELWLLCFIDDFFYIIVNIKAIKMKVAHKHRNKNQLPEYKNLTAFKAMEKHFKKYQNQ